MATPTRRTAEEARRLGEAIYERDIRPQVEATHRGEYVAIDLDSGDYAIGDMVVTASKRLRERRPDADVWGCAGRLPDAGQHRGRFPAEERLIEGYVNVNLEAVITLPVEGPAGQTQEIEAVVDTGSIAISPCLQLLSQNWGCPFKIAVW